MLARVLQYIGQESRTRKELPYDNPYVLLPGHPHSDPERVIDVTEFLNYSMREMLSRELASIKHSDRAFLGLPLPLAVGMNPEMPVVISTFDEYSPPNLPKLGGYARSEFGGTGLLSRDADNYSYVTHARWVHYPLLALARDEKLSTSDKQELIEAFERAMRDPLEGSGKPSFRLGQPSYKWLERPINQMQWPGKYYRLINTVVNDLPVR